ncbi:MAG: GntG family PLP-dependent aldolase [Bacillota bacterium]|nr:GntG family PLP-dependent aldolase [Bacillota bacterium]
MERRIDLRSDTVTLPPPGMLDVLRGVELGDDYYHDDPTVKRLERKAAQMLGKEAALLVLSGTMGNLTSVMSQAPAGSEVIVEHDAHTFHSEAGGMARFVGAMPKRIPGVLGALDPDVVEAQITKKDVLNGGTSLICVENTHNWAGGTVLPLENLEGLRRVADRHGVKIHMDGARMFNAAVAQRVPPSDIVRQVDSVTFCLSKGLACPLGGVVCGSREFIETARHCRQAVGGGMRQAGIIAALGIWALDNMVERLADDHRNARRLADLVAAAGFGVDFRTVQTNMVKVDTSPHTAEEFKAALNARGIDMNIIAPAAVRLVTHWQITAEHIEEVGREMMALRR